MNDRPQLPDPVRQELAREMRPVRPLLLPWQRTALLVPAAALAWLAAPAALGLRGDLARIGPLLAWGGSLFQLGLAVGLIALALRETVPGSAVAAPIAWWLLATAAALIALLAFVTNTISPEQVPRLETMASWSFCWTGAVLVGATLLLLLFVLVARGLPMRPALAGGLAGMAAGTAVDGGWRLYCNYSSPVHVLSSHGGAVLALALAGLVAGTVMSGVRRRR